MSTSNKLWSVAILGLLLSTFGCAKKHESLLVQGEAQLLENPYPMGYPSSDPKPNKSIKLLKNERVVIIDEHIDKDYLVYKVRTLDGLEGYLLAGPGIKKSSEQGGK